MYGTIARMRLRNAEDPAQDATYRKLRELPESDPEWHDGEVLWSSVGSQAGRIPTRVSV
jgi:hypothetical protein